MNLFCVLHLGFLRFCSIASHLSRADECSNSTGSICCEFVVQLFSITASRPSCREQRRTLSVVNLGNFCLSLGYTCHSRPSQLCCWTLVTSAQRFRVDILLLRTFHFILCCFRTSFAKLKQVITRKRRSSIHCIYFVQKLLYTPTKSE